MTATSRIYFGLSLALLILVLVGCKSEPTAIEQAQMDRILIEEYAQEQGLNGEFDDEGIYWEITAGEDTAAGYPALTDTLVIEYQTAFLNGEIFDRSVEAGVGDTVILALTIEGWLEIMPSFNRGASGYFIVPSRLAYGRDGYRVVPPNTVLRYDITLHDFF